MLESIKTLILQNINPFRNDQNRNTSKHKPDLFFGMNTTSKLKNNSIKYNKKSFNCYEIYQSLLYKRNVSHQ